jgi:hypothetical protein
VAHRVRHAIRLRHLEVHDRRVEAGFLAQLAGRCLGERLAFLDDSGDDVPVPIDRAMQQQEVAAPADDDGGLARRPQSAATAAWSFAVASLMLVPLAK